MEDAHVLQLNRRKFSDLYLCFCGYATCKPRHSFGPAVRPTYVLHYIMQGKGRFSTGKEDYFLRAGQGFLIKPEVQTYYEADPDEPWTYLWVGFAGEKVGEYLSDLGLGGKASIFQCAYGDELERIVLAMLEHNTYTVANEYLLEAGLYEFFSVLARNLEIEADKQAEDDNLYIRKAVEYIQNRYAYPLQVHEIAAYVGINRSYLYTLFMKQYGMSPKEYLTTFRITRAAQLLEITEMSVESVAMSCGYQNALGFSKIFKDRMGITPSAYKKKMGERLRETRKGPLEPTRAI